MLFQIKEHREALDIPRSLCYTAFGNTLGGILMSVVSVKGFRN